MKSLFESILNVDLDTTTEDVEMWQKLLPILNKLMVKDFGVPVVLITSGKNDTSDLVVHKARNMNCRYITGVECEDWLGANVNSIAPNRAKANVDKFFKGFAKQLNTACGEERFTVTTSNYSGKITMYMTDEGSDDSDDIIDMGIKMAYTHDGDPIAEYVELYVCDQFASFLSKRYGLKL